MTSSSFSLFASDDHLERRNAPLLAIGTMGRPTHMDDPLPRDPIVALKKLKVEGNPLETMTVLGWQIDTRRLLIQLPSEKADIWDKELENLIRDGDKGFATYTLQRSFPAQCTSTIGCTMSLTEHAGAKPK
jgi:hypothetical protein